MPNDEFLFENQTFTIQGFSYRPLDKNSEEMTRNSGGGLPEMVGEFLPPPTPEGGYIRKGIVIRVASSKYEFHVSHLCAPLQGSGGAG